MNRKQQLNQLFTDNNIPKGKHSMYRDMVLAWWDNEGGFMHYEFQDEETRMGAEIGVQTFRDMMHKGAIICRNTETNLADLGMFI